MKSEAQIKIAKLLIAAAKNRDTCTFQQIFSLFPKDVKAADVYQALEDAADSIVPLEVANYSSLMAKKDTGCPGDGFFDTFKIKRSSEYESIVGKDTLTLDLTKQQKMCITQQERSRVYRHASGNHV